MEISYNKLWKLLIDKNVNKTYVVENAHITTNVMAKLGKNQSVAVESLLRICKVLDCKLDDIVEYK